MNELKTVIDFIKQEIDATEAQIAKLLQINSQEDTGNYLFLAGKLHGYKFILKTAVVNYELSLPQDEFEAAQREKMKRCNA